MEIPEKNNGSTYSAAIVKAIALISTWLPLGKAATW
jgi:hypothetical protein